MRQLPMTEKQHTAFKTVFVFAKVAKKNAWLSSMACGARGAGDSWLEMEKAVVKFGTTELKYGKDFMALHKQAESGEMTEAFAQQKVGWDVVL